MFFVRLEALAFFCLVRAVACFEEPLINLTVFVRPGVLCRRAAPHLQKLQNSSGLLNVLTRTLGLSVGFWGSWSGLGLRASGL